MSTDIDSVAGRLDRAQRHATETMQLGDDLSSADAYEIQHRLLAHRHARGEALIGTKLGMTSKAKMVQVGVTDVIVGQLTDAMSVPDGGELELTGLIHPRIEPEVAFRLACDVDLDDPHTDTDIANLEVELTIVGETVESGNTGEILAGAATAAVPLTASPERGRSTVRASVAGLGEVTVHAVGGRR